ncbi:M14 family metallocarboxypeptidase [Pelagicoccus sp. SDUM812003]|uniref:M14 family metallopeptidase n=1 Tax=Pelagicoccus sp. SDUM812003 TaxID=3041267 RepID=UPI00280D5C8F|nr:M14 family metallocarboxypeptidase [Pelagicoccus sp. SDUM812003]MDQ8202000.1 M14 family metallocarboxypeptidase [Pelagicoccus sp. SDUM812003]
MLDPASHLQSLVDAARADGFAIHEIGKSSAFEHPIYLFKRSASHSVGQGTPPRIYLSAGVHGDEPAPPLALLALLREQRLPRTIDISLCPLLNPDGFVRNCRENGNQVDLNRDFKRLSQPESRALADYLEREPARFDASICMHEDWESEGFYIYCQDEEQERSIAAEILKSIVPIGPIERAEEIDGHAARDGIIAKPILQELADRDDWPEAFLLVSRSPKLHFTIESPSSLDLSLRIRMQIAAVTRLVQTLARESGE